MNGTMKTMARVFLAAAVVLTIGFATVQGADAKKVTVKAQASVKDRVQTQRDLCELIGGGTLSVTSTSIITFTTCKGGTEGGTHCTHTADETTCTKEARSHPATDVRGDVANVASVEIEGAQPDSGSPATTGTAAADAGTMIVAADEDQP